jgi:hypothetical protein
VLSRTLGLEVTLSGDQLPVLDRRATRQLAQTIASEFESAARAGQLFSQPVKPPHFQEREG